MNHRITKGALKALIQHASEDAYRVDLACIRASLDGSTLVATDGYTLLLRHDPMAGEGGMRPAEDERRHVGISLDACTRAVKVCPARGVIEITATTDGATITILEGDGQVTASLDASYPCQEVPYWHVIPSRDRDAASGSIGISPPLMARMCAALSGSRSIPFPVAMAISGPLDPVRLDVAANTKNAIDDCAWIGIIMPTRL